MPFNTPICIIINVIIVNICMYHKNNHFNHELFPEIYYPTLSSFFFNSMSLPLPKQKHSIISYWQQRTENNNKTSRISRYNEQKRKMLNSPFNHKMYIIEDKPTPNRVINQQKRYNGCLKKLKQQFQLITTKTWVIQFKRYKIWN